MAKERIGPYHLERRIGEGGQSVVWAATDVRSGRQVALKVLRPGLASPSDVARLRREGATLAALQDPGLPRGFELYEDPSAGTLALAMELIEGHTLAEAGRLEPGAVLVLARELVRVVAVLHQRGIVHRDIKPGNILLRPGWASPITAGTNGPHDEHATPLPPRGRPDCHVLAARTRMPRHRRLLLRLSFAHLGSRQPALRVSDHRGPELRHRPALAPGTVARTRRQDGSDRHKSRRSPAEVVVADHTANPPGDLAGTRRDLLPSGEVLRPHPRSNTSRS